MLNTAVIKVLNKNKAHLRHLKRMPDVNRLHCQIVSVSRLGTNPTTQSAVPTRLYHNQISLWILGNHHGEFNDLGILQREKEKKLNELSEKSVKSVLLGCMIYIYIYIY